MKLGDYDKIVKEQERTKDFHDLYETVTLADICQFIRNGANIKQFQGAGGIPITRIETLSNDKFNFDKLGYANIYDTKKYENYMLEIGDILISHINSIKYLGRVVQYRGGLKNIIHGMNLLCVRLLPRAIPTYIEWYLKTDIAKRYITTITKKAVNQASFNITDLKKMSVILPSISVQSRIAAILDKVDAICRKRKECIKMLDDLVKARFVEMFGDIHKNTNGFQSLSGKELFLFSSGKFLPSSKRLTSGISVYGGNGKVWYTDSYLINHPTIIIGRVGAYCGNISLVTEPVWITDNAIYIKKFKKPCFDLKFLYYLMYFLNFNQYADYFGQPKITQDPLNNIYYIIPPLEKQKQFSDFTKQIEYAKSSMQSQLQEAETLKAALMQQYFSQPTQDKICA